MWPWKRQTSNADLLERLESLERRFKTLLADVDEYFHLVRRAENRMTKKAAAVESEASDVSTSVETAAPANGSMPGRRLNPHQIEVQQQILKRRAGLT